jgi:hypothetical protein
MGVRVSTILALRLAVWKRLFMILVAYDLLHELTNSRLCPMLNGTMKPEDIGMNGDSSFGAVPAPLTL